MPGSSDQHFFEQILFETFNQHVEIRNSSFSSGGCINNALHLVTSIGDFFLKWNAKIPDDMFECEAAGLKILRNAGELHIPEVHGFGKINGRHYLLMEYVKPAAKQADYWEDFGRALAKQHKDHVHDQNGLDRSNYIGRLPQENDFYVDWVEFFIHKRLEVQLQLALNNRVVDQQFAVRFRRFYHRLPELLPADQPGLLHGDLWSGNVMTGSDGRVSLIDPAVYYGHREIELAFTQLFGGFGSAFYSAYQEVYPMEPGFEARTDIYNMYPLMVHVNLFGTSYLSGVDSVLQRFG